ncbi:HNH endonuclease [Pseudomonas fulva]|uniref:HNH endonuclease n=1 Tax=Pseudomonas fulva TaxID=47880 RepID=UPI0018AA212F|nr:HNH endonuclease signature motif containing protein [Pseudomonas fulva]MBF8679867.1 HNH endonuclease [Pseudomonas fulva]MBF8717604.1 HNH endonuclease [Pseudomonas fulva]MBF8784670.1 HNH endonuclease [Pseudomonas fulva]
MARLKTVASRLQASVPDRVNTIASDSWRSGLTSSQRGYDYRWQKARERFLHDNPLCVYCDRLGRTTAARVVDHVVPHRGDKVLFWDPTNWQALCKSCHDSVKQAEEAAGFDG